jgi:hypothetical protein
MVTGSLQFVQKLNQLGMRDENYLRMVADRGEVPRRMRLRARPLDPVHGTYRQDTAT